MADDKDAGDANEATFAYPGWRVTVASSIGVFVSFGSLLVYTFGIFLKPLTEEFAWSRQAVSLAFGIAAMALAAALDAPVPALRNIRSVLAPGAPAHYPVVSDDFRMRFRIPGPLDASHRPPLRRICHPGSGRQWRGSPGLFASCLHVV